MLGNAFLFLGALLLFSAIWSHWELVARMRPPALPPRLARYPSLTVIRPIKGLDCEAEENLRAALEMEYQGPL